MIEWPMPFKEYTISMIVNGKKIGAFRSSSDNELSKEFRRPTFAETETGRLGTTTLTSHKDIPFTIQNDTVTIKFEIL